MMPLCTFMGYPTIGASAGSAGKGVPSYRDSDNGRFSKMGSIGKKSLSSRVITYEIIAFIIMIALLWLDEIIDIPYLFLGSEKTPVNWRESIFETLVILAVALIIIRNTLTVFKRLKYLEGFLRICSSCKKIRDEKGNWQSMESYIHERSEARFSHGLCPHCAEKLYPEVFAENKKN